MPRASVCSSDVGHSLVYRRPAFYTALFFLAGMAAAPRVAPLSWSAGYAVVALAAACCIRVRGVFVMLAACAVIVAGIATGIDAFTPLHQNVDVCSAFGGDARVFYATIDGDIDRRPYGIVTHATVHAARDSGRTIAIDGVRALVRCTHAEGDSIGDVRRGDRVLLFGRLRAPQGIRNPGELDHAQALRAEGITITLSVHGGSNVELVARDSVSGVIARIASLRRAIAAALERHVGGDEGALLEGLLVGMRGTIDESITRAFIASGTFHVLAVSGLHVGFVTIILLALLSPVLNRYAHFALLAASLAGYTMLAGGAPSIRRAALMAAMLASARIFERIPDGLNIIGAAAFLVALFDPGSVYGAGYHLSFAAAIGLVVVYPRLWRVIGARIEHPRVATLARVACVSVAAQVATLPLTALYFERLSPVGVVSNLLIVPASGVALGLAAMVSAAAPVPALASMIGDLARLFVHAMIALTAWFASLPGASFILPPFSAVDAAVFYLGALFVVLAATRRVFLARLAVVSLLVALALVLRGAPDADVLPPGRLTVAMLDVGQGDGIVIRFPHGATMVVDAGPSPVSLLRAPPVAAFLARHGIGRVRALVLTHLHADHIGGAARVLDVAVVDTLYHSGERTGDGRAYELDSMLAATCTPSRVARAGESLAIDTNVRVMVLHPDSGTVGSDGMTGDGNMNNGSVVLRLVYGSTSILLSGDLERPREEALAQRFGDILRSDILKTGHHGSKTSTTPGYLAIVHPRVALVSVGENFFGHPSPSVIERLRDGGIEIDRTDEDGAVIWTSDGAEWRRIQWR